MMGTLTDRLPGIGPLADMLRPPPGLEVDFTRPAAAPALVPAGSVSWRIFDNPVTLFVGGVAAVILELAEPSVRAGVWDHSSFRRDPLGRLRRTGMAAMITVYAPRPAAEAMIARVVAMHDKVRGELPDGTPYYANDPVLLDWVQATASFGFIEAYHAYAKPLSTMERDAAFAEGAVAARLYGAHEAPQSAAAWEALLDRTLPGLHPSDTLDEFLDIMRSAPIFPAPLRPVQRLLVRAAIAILPGRVRTRLGLDGREASSAERAAVKLLARIGARAVPESAPSRQAGKRMASASVS